MTITAVFENGVFRPIEKVDLPEGQEVEVEVVKLLPTEKEEVLPPMSEGLAKIYEILGERYDSGYTDTAERHNEHQA
ncbi:MAG: antitoxin family protein [Planctomycetales bacterium]